LKFLLLSDMDKLFIMHISYL